MSSKGCLLCNALGASKGVTSWDVAIFVLLPFYGHSFPHFLQHRCHYLVKETSTQCVVQCFHGLAQGARRVLGPRAQPLRHTQFFPWCLVNEIVQRREAFRPPKEAPHFRGLSRFCVWVSLARESDLPQAANQTEGLDQSVGCTLRNELIPLRYTCCQVPPTLLNSSTLGRPFTNMCLTCVTPCLISAGQ